MNLTLALTLLFSLNAHAIKGLAMAVNVPQDLITLNVETYHNWSADGATPLIYGVPSKCYPVAILSNEPNAIAPYGTNQTPQKYAQLFRDVRARCNDMRLVIGNVSVESWAHLGGQERGAEWLAEMLPLVSTNNYAIGAHCYSSSAVWCIAQLAEIKRMIRGAELWVTEYGIATGDPQEMYKFMRWIDRHAIAGYAYTNRQPSQCGATRQGWEITSDVNLINCDGSLNPMGQVFSDFGRSEIAR
mgnify:CR=1 FL=1